MVGFCYLSLINLAVRSGGRCLLSTREERPFALARVAQKHDMHAGMTTEARPQESSSNNNLRKNERPKSLLLATPAGTPADAPLVVSNNTGGNTVRRDTWVYQPNSQTNM